MKGCVGANVALNLGSSDRGGRFLREDAIPIP